MGRELNTSIRINRKQSQCRVLLESQELIIRGTMSRRILFAQIRKLDESGGVLRFQHGDDNFEIEAGTSAEDWKKRIQNPRTRCRK